MKQYLAQNKKRFFSKCGGFTLMEMVIALGIFSLVVVAFVGITLSILNAQRKAANVQIVQENARFALELMTKEMRTGTAFAASTVCASAGKEIRFTSTDPLTPGRTYFLSDARLMRLKALAIFPADCASAREVSGEELRMDNLTFSLRGEIPESSPLPNDGQPVITISLSVSGRDPRFGSQTMLNLQTTVVSRVRDLP